MDALSRQQSEAIDRLAEDEYGMSGPVLMENAGREISLITQEFSGSIAVVCGPGNNGGDGFVCARHLVNQGREVRIHLVPSPDAFRPGSASEINLSIAAKMGIPIAAPLGLEGAEVVVDALFGTGLSRTVSGLYEAVIARINRFCGPVIAVDLPSGLDADTGEVLGCAVQAHLTATMVAPKLGLERGMGPSHAAEVRIVDIGVPRELIRRVRELGL